MAINHLLYKRLNYDPTKFKPITILASSPNVLIASPKLGVTTVAELIDKAKADPGGIAYGSQGIGATSHLTTALFERMAGVKFTHVPYRRASKQQETPVKSGLFCVSIPTVSQTAA